jgi:uncharacterized protein (TIGR03083 family)
VRSDDVREAAEVCTCALSHTLGRDWSAPADGLDMSVAADASPAALVATVRASAEVLAAVLEATPEDTRGFHPDGSPDPSGFAAMACDELLVHTDDAARGLGVAFVPDPHLAARVLRRLFPWAPRRELAWPTLRWANGRTALGDRPFLESWRWHCAPLVEWDGTGP